MFLQNQVCNRWDTKEYYHRIRFNMIFLLNFVFNGDFFSETTTLMFWKMYWLTIEILPTVPYIKIINKSILYVHVVIEVLQCSSCTFFKLQVYSSSTTTNESLLWLSATQAEISVAGRDVHYRLKSGAEEHFKDRCAHSQDSVYIFKLSKMKWWDIVHMLKIDA